MRKFKILFILLLIHTGLTAQMLTVGNISQHIVTSTQKFVKGKNKPIVASIYAESYYRPLWIGNHQKAKMSQLLNAIKNPFFNYKNKSFDQKSIGKLLFELDNNEISPAQKARVYGRLDVILTNSFVRLVRFIVQGDVDWNLVQTKLKALEYSDKIKAHWDMSVKKMPGSGHLATTIKDGNIYSYLKSLIPMEKRYTQLIGILKKYLRMPKFPAIAYSHKTLQVGDSDKRIEQIKRQLQILGDYPRHSKINSKFTHTLQNAVLRYQKRHLLALTGKIDKTVIYYLNKSLNHNIQAIITNLDKTKLYPKYFEPEHIEVNIPDFNLRYYQNGTKLLKMGLIVGRIDRPTPIFSDKVQYMVFNPTWTIPDSLIKRDLIHVLRENPMYLVENNIHVFSGNKKIDISQDMLDPYEYSKKRVPYRFVQYPGENNALGRVKFMFPNRHAVYLHDTDNKSLFSRRYKVYSSGCVRVKKPFTLARTLLKHSSRHYSYEHLASVIETNKPTTVKLNKFIPVHMLYFTVYVEDNMAYFKHDIYLYDKIIEESSEGHTKATFSVPKQRLITIKKKDDKPLSN
ncbi:MAG: Peptidoglycan-binding domain 1 [uncultured Sulfurovum sp.]|uniref:Peptidoglycan-binding domain 1 n=1 Tax=uncultured Sulfurovum sp. TaxID=269237 RepID=A0A6S6UED3_9BACT|nr:MAG: Peptidoglycan-binding domain 1 [uncultured Sulfurovum sp.]